jgi:flagellar motor switch protein FliN/FliY
MSQSFASASPSSLAAKASILDQHGKNLHESPSERESHRRKVMSIQVPVSVTLARKKCSLERIVDLVPGSLLTFDVHCDQPLTLEAGGTAIGSGEAVKIGDKFGLRVREVLLTQDNVASQATK